jgi:thioredoxin reductase (NADPH)
MFDWDAIIIGGGPAGLTAGLYLSRANFRTLLIEEETLGGKIKNVEWIENYPGFASGISGAQLASEMITQAEKYGLKMEIAKVSGLEIFSESRYVNCASGRGYTTSVVLVAGGSHHKKLGVPGEEELQGKGVFTCAFCDGGQFANRTVAVCGGGDSGVTEALYMSKIAAEVILVEALPRLSATALLQARVTANSKIKVRCGVKVTGITGSNQVDGLEIQDPVSGQKESLRVNGVLVQIGFNPNTDFLNDTISLENKRQITVNEKMETNLPYILAAGDIRSNSPGQVSTAVGDGTTAAMAAIRYLQSREEG